MIKKNNTPMEDVLKAIASENNLQYVNPENRKKKAIVVTDGIVALKDADKNTAHIGSDKTMPYTSHKRNRLMTSRPKKTLRSFATNAEKLGQLYKTS